jgi:thioredoxin 2
MRPSRDNNAEIIQCGSCGARNRIPQERTGSQARCGKCGALLHAREQPPRGPEVYLFRCPECRTRNRILAEKVNASPVCGKCKKLLRTEELFLSQPFAITDASFESLVSKSPLPVLLFAWAPWCPTCRAFLPIIDDFARESKGRVRVGKVNVDQSPALSSKFNILSVPQILIFDGGELRETLPGAMQKHEIMIKMASYL